MLKDTKNKYRKTRQKAVITFLTAFRFLYNGKQCGNKEAIKSFIKLGKEQSRCMTKIHNPLIL